MKDKKRILLVSCGGLGNGGVQAIMMGIVRSLSHKFIFDVLLFTSETRYHDKEFLTYGGDIIRIPHYEGSNVYLKALDFYTRDIYIYYRVKKILRNRDTYIAIHCNKEYESAPILKAAYDCGIPIRICHNHVLNQTGGFLCNFINNIRIHYIKRCTTLRIGCSEESCHSLYGERGFVVMSNFYDDKRFNPQLFDRESKRSLLSIVQVGALSSNKNQIFSLHVLSEIRRCGIDAHLNIIGFELEIGYKDKLQNEIEKYDLSSYVNLLPGNSNIPYYLSKSDCFLMPSISEGFGIALIEAQAMGVKCFASSTIPSTTNCGGITFLDLYKGAHYWASAIVNDTQDGRYQNYSYDTEKFKLSHISKEYERIYLNEQ